MTFQSSVNDLGVLIDSQLTMREHVQRVCRTSFYQLRQLCVIRSSLSMKTCTALVHAFVTSRLDYCNSLLSGINKELLNRLESVLLWSAARLVMRKRKFRRYSEHSTLAPGSPKNRIQTRHPRLQMSSRRCPVLFDRVAVEGSGQSGSPSPQVCHPR